LEPSFSYSCSYLSIPMAAEGKGSKLFSTINRNQTKEALELIQDPETDINWSNPEENEFTPLLRATWLNNLPVIESLLAREDTLPNKADEDGRTPLRIACLKGNADAVRILASDPRVDVNLPDNELETPLWVACLKKESQCVKILLASSKAIDTRTASSNWNTTPAQQAKFKGYLEIAELVDRYEENPEEIVVELRKELEIQSFFPFSPCFPFTCFSLSLFLLVSCFQDVAIFPFYCFLLSLSILNNETQKKK